MELRWPIIITGGGLANETLALQSIQLTWLLRFWEVTSAIQNIGMVSTSATQTTFVDRFCNDIKNLNLGGGEEWYSPNSFLYDELSERCHGELMGWRRKAAAIFHNISNELGHKRTAAKKSDSDFVTHVEYVPKVEPRILPARSGSKRQNNWLHRCVYCIRLLQSPGRWDRNHLSTALGYECLQRLDLDSVQQSRGTLMSSSTTRGCTKQVIDVKLSRRNQIYNQLS